MGARLTGGLARILRTSAWLLAVALAAPGLINLVWGPVDIQQLAND